MELSYSNDFSMLEPMCFDRTGGTALPLSKHTSCHSGSQTHIPCVHALVILMHGYNMDIYVVINKRHDDCSAFFTSKVAAIEYVRSFIDDDEFDTEAGDWYILSIAEGQCFESNLKSEMSRSNCAVLCL
jgi:hypothetical protein